MERVLRGPARRSYSRERVSGEQVLPPAAPRQKEGLRLGGRGLSSVLSSVLPICPAVVSRPC